MILIPGGEEVVHMTCSIDNNLSSCFAHQGVACDEEEKDRQHRRKDDVLWPLRRDGQVDQDHISLPRES